VRSAVVTGCGSGIGAATSEVLLREGWQVVGIEREEESAEQASLRFGAGGTVICGDVAASETLEQAALAARKLAPLGAWINNAGVVVRGNLHKPVAADIERVLAVNVSAYLWGCSAAIRCFLDQRSQGAIVNVSSVHATRGYPGFAAYDVSKGAVEALTRYVAVEYGPFGIRANSVAPGAVRTRLSYRDLDAMPDPAAARVAFEGSQPLRRAADASEIASAIYFLLSEASSFVTGHTLVVDGGMTATCLPVSPDLELRERFAREDAGPE
jgi:NAD(P)-dependent dehydrogenase (short-subunit alcohol dehydrogenase family)